MKVDKDEFLSDVIETLRMVQTSGVDGRTVVYWDDLVGHLQEVFDENAEPPEPSADVVERILVALKDGLKDWDEGWGEDSTPTEDLEPFQARRIAPIIEAEVERQVRERENAIEELWWMLGEALGKGGFENENWQDCFGRGQDILAKWEPLALRCSTAKDRDNAHRQ